MPENQNQNPLVTQVQNDVRDIKAAVANADKLMKEVAEQSRVATENNTKVSNEAIEAARKAIEQVTTLATRLTESEQKIFDQVKNGKEAPKTLGSIIIDTDEFKNFASGMNRSMRVDVQNNTITGQSGSPSRNSNTIVAPDRLAGINAGAFRRLRVADVIPQGTTSSNMIEYTRETGFVNNAAETGEGDSKPQSNLTFDLQTSPVATIAHWLKVSKQVREDAPMLASYIDTRLAYGVELRKDSQLLNGNGTGQNLSGLLKSNNYTGFSPVAGDTALDSLNRMKYLVDAADYHATAILMNPVTWGEIERIKGNDEHYVIGNPLNPFGPFLWGLPVVTTNAMPQGKAHVSAIEILAQIFNRSGTVVEAFEQDDVNVQKNLITIRAEARLALAVFRPVSAQYGALTKPGASA